jgi:hypothetical protein
MSSNTLPDLSSTESTLLIKFVEFADKHELTRVNVNHIHSSTKEFGIRPIILKAIFDKLCQKSILSLTRNRNYESDDEFYYEINSEFADQIDSYVGFMSNQTALAPVSPEIPASDRFVSIGDNQPQVASAKAALDELSSAVRHPRDTNVPLTADPEDQILLSKEIDYIKEIVSQPRIHIFALWDSTKNNSTLKWLMEQGISGVVRELAVKAFNHLDALIHFLRSL